MITQARKRFIKLIPSMSHTTDSLLPSGICPMYTQLVPKSTNNGRSFIKAATDFRRAFSVVGDLVTHELLAKRYVRRTFTGPRMA